MKKIVLLFCLVMLFGCGKNEIPDTEIPVTSVSAFSYVKEVRSTGEIVEKHVDSWVNLYYLPVGVVAKSTQSMFDLLDGYVVGTDNKSYDRSYLLSDSGGGDSQTIEPGNYFVYVVAYDDGGKYSYKTFNVKEGQNTMIRKVFDSLYPKYSFESW